jgi:ubiquinone/menaquinone biosynthesis C-methylase UbiE
MIISKRFTAFTSFAELREMYHKSLKEFYRVLKKNGIVIFKCQDVNGGGTQYFSHCWLMNEAINLGYYPKDLFILLAKNRITDNRQQHTARKYHSYYWVFEKRNCRVDYSVFSFGEGKK